MGKIIPILFFIYLGFLVISHSWKLKKDNCKACKNLDWHKLIKILHIIEPYYNINDHMRIENTHDAIKTKYHPPNMNKNLCHYVTSCVSCQTRNQGKVKPPLPPLQETDAPP